ncbi:MAG: Bacterial regulatory protein luxR family [Gaiellales bacterium]|nr:Bacterial regulatory protein luxR family [Gaiellales bacterium]
MQHPIAQTRTLRVLSAHPGPGKIMPSCSTHPDSFVRRYRTQGPTGPGVYPQCVPGNGDAPHLLGWLEALPGTGLRGDLEVLTAAEMDVLTDAANGLTRAESAAKRFKGSETVKTQRRSILLKLGARNMAQAVGMTHAFPTREG